ncbi:hypothetical protein GCM10017784_11350 [Deinococcus indicus]|uniref:hypothetical protein n=1 Tax=Deinococcus indicus TaxID=223556 RepID=UPI00174D43D2|nr:hypothetical protein [Deinococcus indicus]GHG21556.1 hypothetical protein GCM10017784_11350 [Deinococcus indicus]
MTPNDSTPKKAENAQVQAVRKEFTVSGDERDLDSGTHALSGRHSQAEMNQDARQLLDMVQARPGQSASAYAAALGWSHGYTRKLLGILEGLGQLDSKRVSVYRVAVQP